MFRTFLDTLGFLTLLAPARVIPEERMARCMAHMIPVGLTLGLAVVLPFWLGLFSHAPWVQAFCMVGLSAVLTRGLHFDGLADVADAVTTHADPTRFWTVIKDSRAGAFGVMALVLALVGQVILFQELSSAGEYAAIVWAFALGRAACVALGYGVRHIVRPGLGKLYIDGATPPVAMATVAATFVLGAFMAGPLPALVAMAAAGVALWPLQRLAKHVDGANGDFLGAAIILGELAAGLGIALTV